MPAQRCRHRDGRTQLRQLKAGRKAQQQHSSPGAVRLHSQNAHSSALLASCIRMRPLRVPKGSLLKGDPLDVRIGGEVPAGFDSGEVTVTFLGDANGYLLPNPYTDDPSAPKQLRLTMDVAFDTEVQRANGAFNQTLLQVELVGYAIADTQQGSLIVDAVGVVEPEVLGTETNWGAQARARGTRGRLP